MMEKDDIKFDYSRGVTTYRSDEGSLSCGLSMGCCKLSVFDWLCGINDKDLDNIYEIRFKNTRKQYFISDNNFVYNVGEIVVVEATNGYDVGVITLKGAVVAKQVLRHNYTMESYDFKKIHRKAKVLDIEKWQEAISREHITMIRARQIAAKLELNMKIGDVEFQGDGTKAIFYYIADERVDFRQLIRNFAEEFRIRIEMKQIGARQEAGLIGGIGVCGQELCCSRYMSDFKSITTQAARSQDLSLNPQKLAGQCSKLKCCINYEAATYLDAQKCMPVINDYLDTVDGPVYLVKTDVLRGIMWFSHDMHSMTNMFPLNIKQIREVLNMNARGQKADFKSEKKGKSPTEFKTSLDDDSISRFDDDNSKVKKKGGKRRAGPSGANKSKRRDSRSKGANNKN